MENDENKSDSCSRRENLLCSRSNEIRGGAGAVAASIDAMLEVPTSR